MKSISWQPDYTITIIIINNIISISISIAIIINKLYLHFINLQQLTT